MKLVRELFRDECGSVLTAEAVMLGSLVVVGATVGLKTAGNAVEGEIRESAYALRSLDQSYYYTGYSSCTAATAGSSFVQVPVEQSIRELREFEERQSKLEEEKQVEQKKDPDTSGPMVKPRKKNKPKPKPESDGAESTDESSEATQPIRSPIFDSARSTDA